MDDRNPAKLLLCARDIVTGVLLPWHVSGVQHERLTSLSGRLEDAAANVRLVPDMVYALLEECVALADWLADDTIGVRTVFDKMDRARLSMRAILAYALSH